jgi:hypothetical protein
MKECSQTRDQPFIGALRTLFGCIGVLLLHASIAPAPAQAADACFAFAPPATGKQASWNEDPACAEFLANVNDLCDSEPPICEFKISPKHPDITLPKWQPLPAASSRDLIESLIKSRALVGGAPRDLSGPERVWPYYEQWVDDTLHRGTLRIEQGDLPLSGSTKPERVYRLTLGACENAFEAHGKPGAKSMPFVNMGPNLYSERLRRWYVAYEDARKRGASGPPPDSALAFYANAKDPFLYHGKTWLFSYRIGGGIDIRAASRGEIACALVPRTEKN